MLCGGCVGLLLVGVVGALWGCVGGEVAYRWNKAEMVAMAGRVGGQRWRATSFAMAEEKIFLTLVDTAKEDSGNGVVGAFNMSASGSPDISVFPFPNFYKINDPLRGKITTPVALRTDDCHRLWLLDAAVQNISGTQRKTNPAIYVFNTNTAQLLRTFNIPATQWTSASFFVNFVLATQDPRHDCDDTHAYLADFNRFHLLTYHFLRNTSALKSHPFFSPDPLVHTPDPFLLNPRHQDLNGLFGLALAQYRSPDRPDALYFHPLAATHEFRVATRLLQSEGELSYGDVAVFKDKGENAAAGASAFDRETDAIFLAEVKTRKIGVLRLRGESAYWRYDLGLKSGRIADLMVERSALWVLVDDGTEVAIHKVAVAEIEEEEEDGGVVRQGASAGGRCGSEAAILHLLVLLPFVGFL